MLSAGGGDDIDGGDSQLSQELKRLYTGGLCVARIIM